MLTSTLRERKHRVGEWHEFSKKCISLSYAERLVTVQALTRVSPCWSSIPISYAYLIFSGDAVQPLCRQRMCIPRWYCSTVPFPSIRATLATLSIWSATSFPAATVFSSSRSFLESASSVFYQSVSTEHAAERSLPPLRQRRLR